MSGLEGVGLAAEEVEARYGVLRTYYPRLPPALRPFQVPLQSSACIDNCTVLQHFAALHTIYRRWTCLECS